MSVVRVDVDDSVRLRECRRGTICEAQLDFLPFLEKLPSSREDSLFNFQ